MKPKTKFQKLIMSLSEKLSPITDKQEKYAYQHCFTHMAYHTKKGVMTCGECGQSWTDKNASDNCTCPHCGMKLQINKTRTRVFKDIEYFCIVTVCQGFQVLRFFFVTANHKKGEKAKYSCREAVQRWIAPDGKYATVALLRGLCYFYSDQWDFSSKLEIRPDRNVYNIDPICIYPHQRVIAEVKRNGFKGKYHLKPFDMFYEILTNSKAETLLKAGQYDLLRYLCYTGSNYEGYWNAIKICIRNHYQVQDASMWCDYIRLMEYLGKDTRNPRYVCPANLQEAHDDLHKKREVLLEKERKEEDRQAEIRQQERLKKQQEERAENEIRYKEIKSKFFNIKISDGKICIQVLQDINDFYEEGKALHHCVYTNSYYTKPESLILSARIGNKRLETIEISLTTMEIIQVRGACNQDSKYHEQIVELIKNNMNVIRKIAA